jgi:hypothetical protein
MVFYKGALSYETLQNMSITEILEIKEHANIISKEEADQIEAASKRK